MRSKKGNVKIRRKIGRPYIIEKIGSGWIQGKKKGNVKPLTLLTTSGKFVPLYWRHAHLA